MRVFFLALDALEYDFVSRREFSNLKQDLFFRVEIPRECMSIMPDGVIEPFTPVIWKIILTGETDQSGPTPVDPGAPLWRNPLLNSLKQIGLVRRTYSFLIKKGLLKRGLPERLGFRRREMLSLEESLFRYAERPIIIHNPLTASIKWELAPFHEDFDPERIVEGYLRSFKLEREETLNRIDGEWDLFLTYSKLLDVIGHLFWQRDELVERYYRMMDDFAGELRSKVGGVFVMIVSDHGMMPLEGASRQGGIHSHHAFVSFSHKIDVSPPLKITDIYGIVRERLEA